MAVITLPAAPGFAEIRFRAPAPPVQIARSRWTGAEKAVLMSGDMRWSIEAEMSPIYDVALAQPWIAFFALLKGRLNTFRVPVCPQQHALPEPRSNTAGNLAQGSESVPVDGMTPGAAYLVPGQRATLRLNGPSHQLVTVTQPLVANGSGAGTLHFWPPTRSTLSNDVLTESRNPYVEVALTSDVPEWVQGKGGFYGFTITAEEAF